MKQTKKNTQTKTSTSRHTRSRIKTDRKQSKHEYNLGNSYVVAIPSYKRADVLLQKTLHTLKTGQVDPSRIYIFVANEEEYNDYINKIPKELYHKIVVGKKGIANQRIFISTYFPEGTHVVSIDDDVEELSRRLDDRRLTKVRNLDAFFDKAGKDLKSNGLFLWGIYPVHNPFFMKPGKTTGLKFIIGVLHGYIVRKDQYDLHPSVHSEGKEDYHQTILYYRKDGGVLRFNDVSPKTKFNSEGGLGTDRFEMNARAAEFLQKKYPSIVSIFYRKNGMTEIRLKNLPRDKKIE